MDDLHERIRHLQSRHGTAGLLSLMVDTLYEQGSLGETLDEVEKQDAAMRRLDTRAEPRGVWM